MNKKDKILHVAEKLFWENGYKGTSIREIARSAGVNIAMISYYFGSKEELLQELMEVKSTLLSNKLNTLRKDEAKKPEEKIKLAVDLFIELIFSNLRVSAIFHREISFIQKKGINKAKIIENFISNANNIQKIIIDGQEKNVFKKDIDLELTVLTIISTITQISNTRFYTKNILKIDVMNLTEKDKKILKERLSIHINKIINSYLKIEANESGLT